MIFRLSTRGRRASRAAKSHAANKRFRTALAAVRAHPGDGSRVVPLTVGPTEFQRLFGAGNLVADLRSL